MKHPTFNFAERAHIPFLDPACTVWTLKQRRLPKKGSSGFPLTHRLQPVGSEGLSYLCTPSLEELAQAPGPGLVLVGSWRALGDSGLQQLSAACKLFKDLLFSHTFLLLLLYIE